MSTEKVPEKVYFVKANFTNENYYVTSQNLSGETVLAIYVREDLAFELPRDKELRVGGEHRKREMFEKMFIAIYATEGFRRSKDSIRDYSKELTEFLIIEADKFAKGES